MALPSPLITRSPDVMSGAVVFAGTRVPVQTLMDYLEEDGRLDEFLEDFPTPRRAQAGFRMRCIFNLCIVYCDIALGGPPNGQRSRAPVEGLLTSIEVAEHSATANGRYACSVP